MDARSRRQPATRVGNFRESVIRDMTRLAIQHGAVNLSQGFPDFPAPASVIEAARRAIANGENQYTSTWGHPPLRTRLAEEYTTVLGRPVDPDVHVTVTCGVTEGICATMLAVLDPGDELLVLDPAHDNFRPSVFMADATPVSVPLQPPDYELDAERLAAAVTTRTKAILLNTPHNPTGRLFTEAEIDAVAEIVLANDLFLITDEIYDRIVYKGARATSPASRPELHDRTVVINGFGKTYAVTGWRLGYVIAPSALATAIHTTHDFLTICAPTPLQVAAIAALDLPESFYVELVRDYDERRQAMLEILAEHRFSARPPEATYYVLADFRSLPVPQAELPTSEFARWMTTDVGVAVVPGDACYNLPGHGTDLVRFAFCKKLDTLAAAAARLRDALG